MKYQIDYVSGGLGIHAVVDADSAAEAILSLEKTRIRIRTGDKKLLLVVYPGYLKVGHAKEVEESHESDS